MGGWRGGGGGLVAEGNRREKGRGNIHHSRHDIFDFLVQKLEKLYEK